jgi:hypothetical protein
LLLKLSGVAPYTLNRCILAFAATARSFVF